MADEIVYVNVTADVVEVVEVDSLTPEPVLVDVHLGEGLPGSASDGYTFFQEAMPNPTAWGETWFNTVTGASYIYFDSYWIQTSPGQVSAGGLESIVSSHLADPTPHSVYDDIASLTLIYENQIV